ncbi:MAG TPA: hypothetical protein DEG43_09480 [Acidimicrobiaceae bacterium]|nr:hypothetical protein [Acidimicrobiaceae bacterium]
MVSQCWSRDFQFNSHALYNGRMDVARTPGRRDTAPATRSTSAGPRSLLRSVAVPAEHGGWGLTLEPVLLGLLVSWSAAGVCVGLGALLAFLSRTPLKVMLVDTRRQRLLPRTRVARRVFAAETAVIVAVAVGAAASAPPAFWIPLIAIAPLVGLELWFDMRSRSRRLLPELAGAVGMSGVVAIVALAGGSDARLAFGCWLILAARSITAIVAVRDLVGQLHGDHPHPLFVMGADLCAAIIVGAATLIDRATALGALGVITAIAVQRALNLRPAPRAVIIGIRQTLLGLGIVAATAIGVLWS